MLKAKMDRIHPLIPNCKISETEIKHLGIQEFSNTTKDNNKNNNSKL